MTAIIILSLFVILLLIGVYYEVRQSPEDLFRQREEIIENNRRMLDDIRRLQMRLHTLQTRKLIKKLEKED